MAAGVLALALSCGGPGGARRPGALPESDLRIWIPTVVRWQPGAPRELRFVIENVSNRTVALADPEPERARVDVYAGPEDDRLCGTEPPSSADEQAPQIALAPGDRIALRIDLAEACRGVPPGEYRFVVSYRAPRPPAGAKLWAGALPAQYGNVVVERGTAAARASEPPPRRSERARAVEGAKQGDPGW